MKKVIISLMLLAIVLVGCGSGLDSMDPTMHEGNQDIESSDLDVANPSSTAGEQHGDAIPMPPAFPEE